MTPHKISPPNARTATLAELRATILTAFFSPVPPVATLRKWFIAAGIPCFKANPVATRGGGQCFYSVSHVERFLQSRLNSGKK